MQNCLEVAAWAVDLGALELLEALVVFEDRLDVDVEIKSGLQPLSHLRDVRHVFAKDVHRIRQNIVEAEGKH